jgi:hypothetical protein
MLLLAAVLGGASAVLLSAGPPTRTGQETAVSDPAQRGRVQLEAVSLSPAEQTDILEGRIILREVPAPGSKGRTFEAVGIMAGTPDEVLEIVTNYRGYPEFMPRVQRTVVTDETDTVALVEQYLKLPLGVHKRYRLRYIVRGGAEGFRVEWHKVPWPEVPLSQSVVDTSGFWQVGLWGEGRLLVVYRVHTDPGRVPLGMKGLALSLSKREIPKVIDRVRKRHASRFGPREPDPSREDRER